MLLGDWRRREGLTQQEIADALGCIVTTVARYEAGARIPGPTVMIDIYTLTGGAVQPNDFYDLPPLAASKMREAA